MLADLHMLITSGTDFYLLDSRENERLFMASDSALQAATDRLLDKILAAIHAGTIFDAPNAPLLYHMANKGRPVAFREAIATFFADDGKLIAMIEGYRGYQAPGASLCSYFDVSPAHLRVRVSAALAALQRAPSDWEWFSASLADEGDE